MVPSFEFQGAFAMAQSAWRSRQIQPWLIEREEAMRIAPEFPF
jgi:hypothetical protein